MPDNIEDAINRAQSLADDYIAVIERMGPGYIKNNIDRTILEEVCEEASNFTPIMIVVFCQRIASTMSSHEKASIELTIFANRLLDYQLSEDNK